MIYMQSVDMTRVDGSPSKGRIPQYDRVDNESVEMTCLKPRGNHQCNIPFYSTEASGSLLKLVKTNSRPLNS